MISFGAALEIARKLDDVTETEHFESIAFRTPKRIFATFWRYKEEVNLRLSLEAQAEFLENPEAFREIPNSWGKQGWTTVSLRFVDRKSLERALGRARAHASDAEPRRSAKKKTRKDR